MLSSVLFKEKTMKVSYEEWIERSNKNTVIRFEHNNIKKSVSHESPLFRTNSKKTIIEKLRGM